MPSSNENTTSCPIHRLNNYIQRNKLPATTYDVEPIGPANALAWRASITVQGVVYSATGSNKLDARKNTAQKVLDDLKR